MGMTRRHTSDRWSLLSPRGVALFYITQHPGCTKRELADALDVGERAAAKLLGELISAGAVRGSNGSGRPLHYQVNLNAPLETNDGRTKIGAVLRSVD